MRLDEKKLDLAAKIAREAGATRLILFGSALASLETANDLDLACEGVEGWKLFELGARLEKALRVPLDLVPLDEPNRFTEIIERQGRDLL